MGIIKWFFIVLFFVQVKVPMGLKVEYDNVAKFYVTEGGSYCLTLESGKRVWVPVAFTIIKEK